MDIIKKLNRNLLQQPFEHEQSTSEQSYLEQACQIASIYATLENAIAVLSDMKSNRSYLYYGKVACQLGLPTLSATQSISSIWEKEILDRIHPDDLKNKYLEELHFYHFLQNIPYAHRSDYYLSAGLRMRNAQGTYLPMLHRMFYLIHDSNNCTRFALCLYNLSTNTPITSSIIDTSTGQTHDISQFSDSSLLSEREKEVLRLIDNGMTSKGIALHLSLSPYTVNRHRQNILQRLQANNSIEACRIAKQLGII